METYEEKIIQYLQAEILKMDNSSDFGEKVNLTHLEEDIIDELGIPDEVWEEEDYSFFIYTWLNKEGYLND